MKLARALAMSNHNRRLKISRVAAKIIGDTNVVQNDRAIKRKARAVAVDCYHPLHTCHRDGPYREARCR